MKLKSTRLKNKKIYNINAMVEDSNIEIDNVNWKVVIIVTLVVSFFFYSGVRFTNNWITYNRVTEEKNAILKDITAVEEDIEELKVLQEEAEMLTFVEKQAREKLKMVRTDETVYVDLSE